MNDSLSMWTVFDHPSDLPNAPYAARRLEVSAGLPPIYTRDLIQSNTLDGVRHVLRGKGLAPMQRDPADDPIIVEVWV